MADPVVADGPERRVTEAMRAHPWLVAGTGREDTDLMNAVSGLIAKGGAEGVQALALPDGTAVAIKIDGPRALVHEFPRWLLLSHFAQALKPAGSKPGAPAPAHVG